jgi:hypothetical protein
MPHSRARQCISDPTIVRVLFFQQGGEYRLTVLSANRTIRKRKDCRQPNLRIGVLERSSKRVARTIVPRQHSRRRTSHSGRRVLECAIDRLERRAFRRRSKAMQSPERVNRTGIQADLIDTGVADQLDQGQHDILLCTLDKQALRMHPPELIVARQRGDEVGW